MSWTRVAEGKIVMVPVEKEVCGKWAATKEGKSVCASWITQTTSPTERAGGSLQVGRLAGPWR